MTRMHGLLCRVVVVGLAAAALTSCSGGTSGGHGSSHTGSMSSIPTGTGSLGVHDAKCVQLAAAARKIGAAQTALYGGDEHALADLDAALLAIRAGAPAAVQTAIDHLNAGFRSASELLAHPTAANEQNLAALAPQLARDAMTVSGYATSTCGH